MRSCTLTPETTAEHREVEVPLDRQGTVRGIQVRIARSPGVASTGW